MTPKYSVFSILGAKVKTMKLFVSILMLLIALALVPFAWDWRSPFLAEIRPWALKGLIALPLSLIVAEIWLLITSRPEQRALRAISPLGLLAATLALTATLAVEARFHWVRHQVLQADPIRLEKLGRHLIVGYRDLAEVRELVRLRAVAGVFLSSSNVRGKSIADIRKQIQSLQRIRQEQGMLASVDCNRPGRRGGLTIVSAADSPAVALGDRGTLYGCGSA